MLQKTLARVLGDSPSVALHARVAEGNAAKVLIDLSDSANLLALGSRGYGGFAGLPLHLSRRTTKVRRARCFLP